MRERNRFKVGEMVFLSPDGVPLVIGHAPVETYHGVTSVEILWVSTDGSVNRAMFNVDLIFSVEEAERALERWRA